MPGAHNCLGEPQPGYNTLNLNEGDKQDARLRVRNDLDLTNLE